ncbi:hypothetical protein NYA30BAC_02228 [Halomonas sp. NYA30]|tara:strand:- start:425 stop:595 length:171 start_codon:yes stop_codon:yes gene_type:complete
MQSDDFMTGEELGNTLLGVSPGTLHGWEQGRHMPTGTGRTLLRVAEKHPEALTDLS